jgi:4-hydroxybenzoate polyprenyltransferase
MTVEMLFWIVMSMIFARSAAMGFNRVADAAIDSRNPRTAERHIPSGELGMNESLVFVGLSSALFVVSAGMLSLTCLVLAFPVLGLLFAYSYTKRFTWGSHVVLGLAIGMVPMAVWVAVTGEISIEIGVLSLALWTYITGFDILYACQDIDFDRSEGLHSIPVRFGARKAMLISTVMHVVSVISLGSLYWLFALSPVYLIVVAVIAVLFVMEHRLVRPEDLSRIAVAFYNVNSIISLLVLGAILAGVYI